MCIAHFVKMGETLPSIITRIDSAISYGARGIPYKIGKTVYISQQKYDNIAHDMSKSAEIISEFAHLSTSDEHGRWVCLALISKGRPAILLYTAGQSKPMYIAIAKELM